MDCKEIADQVSAEESGKSELFIPDHCTHESMTTMSEHVIDRAEGIMRRYPWMALSIGVGLGYLVSRRLS